MEMNLNVVYGTVERRMTAERIAPFSRSSRCWKTACAATAGNQDREGLVLIGDRDAGAARKPVPCIGMAVAGSA
jgi:hypothetical protein